MGDKNQKSKDKARKLDDSRKAVAREAHDRKQAPREVTFAPAAKKK